MCFSRRGGETQLTPLDFSLAFACVGALAMLSVPFFLKMSPDAGAEISGRPAPSKPLSAP